MMNGTLEEPFMNAVELFQFLGQQPFQPVRVHVKGGQIFDIRFRELAIVGETWLDIGIPAPDETDAIYDYVVTVPLEEISNVERMLPVVTPVYG
jgi:hypothetical protein